MDKWIISRIIASLNKILEEKGSYAQFNDPLYKPIMISRDNFHEIKDIQLNNKIAFIDGGSSEILRSSNFSLQLIRIYYSIYKNNARIRAKKKEFYILINAVQDDNEIIYKTEFFGLEKDKIEFNSFDETIRQGAHRIQISGIGNAIRRFMELEAAEDITDELNSNDIILVDGDLKASLTGETSYFNKLYEKAAEKNITVASLSKSSQLFTERGNALTPLLNEIALNKEWYYYPLVEINNPNHKVEMYIVKLNKKSKYIFKIEAFNGSKYNIADVLSLLKSNSKDPVFLGYPYGLIEADRFARISNDEKEHLKTILMAKLGKGNEKISQYLNILNAHDILDSIG